MRFCSSVFLFLGLCLCGHPVLAQKQEVTLSLGGVYSQSRSFQATGTAQISSDFDLEANYGYRFLHANIAALYGELEFVALPNRSVTTATAIVPKNYASLYVAPGLLQRREFLHGWRLAVDMRSTSSPHNFPTARTRRTSF